MSTFELQDFRKDVVEASQTIPVVIDFWAPWCGPCRVLGPVIEKLASQAGKKWKLVKINTDQHQELAGQFGIRGIPAVKMVYQGKLIAEFTGVKPEHEIKQWLSQHLPAIESAEDEEVEGIDTVRALVAEGKREQAKTLALSLFDQSPEDDELRLWAGLLLLPKTIQRAETLLSPLFEKEPGKTQLEKEALDTLKHLHEYYSGSSTLPEGEEKTLRFVNTAIKATFEEQFEIAIDQFIQSMFVERFWNEELARKSCVALFKILGDDHPVSKSKRRAFSMALY